MTDANSEPYDHTTSLREPPRKQPMPTRETFTAWVTKYALTEGITQIIAEPTNIPDMIGDANNRRHALYHGEGLEWHRTVEGAVARAEAMRSRKIASLRKSIAKLEKVTF